MFILEPEFQKCVLEEEIWKKDNFTIERITVYRFGKIIVDEEKATIQKNLTERNKQNRVIVSDKFEILDKDFNDATTDEIYFSDNFNKTDIERLQNLFNEDAEMMFENEGFEIYDTNVYFEDKIKVTKTDTDSF